MFLWLGCLFGWVAVWRAWSCFLSLRECGLMMMLSVSRSLISILVSIVFLGVLFNLNFSIFGFSEKITSVRLSFLLLLLVLVCCLVKKQGVADLSILKDRVSFLGLICVFVVAISLLISFLLNSSKSNSFYVLSAWLQVFFFISFAVILAQEDKDRFVSFFVTVILLYVALLGVFFCLKVTGNGLYQVRGQLDEMLPQGLNRFLNGYVLLWVIPISVLFGALPRNATNISASVLISLIGIALLAYSGSRQYLLGVFSFIFGAVLISERKWKSASIIIALSMVFFLMFNVLGFDEFKTQLYRRFFEVTIEQSSSGSDRFYRYESVFLFIRDNPITGLGPGGFFNATGLYPDSGILQYLVENGVLLFSLHVASVFIVLLQIFIGIGRYSQVSALLLVFFVVNFFVQNFFNELFLEYYTWLVLPLASFLKHYNPKSS